MNDKTLNDYVLPSINYGQKLLKIFNETARRNNEIGSFTIEEDRDSAWRACKLTCQETGVCINFENKGGYSYRGEYEGKLTYIELDRTYAYNRDQRRAKTRFLFKNEQPNLETIVEKALEAKRYILAQRAAEKKVSEAKKAAKDSRNEILKYIGLSLPENPYVNCWTIGEGISVSITPTNSGKLDVTLEASQLTAEKVKELVTNIRVALDAYIEKSE